MHGVHTGVKKDWDHYVAGTQLAVNNKVTAIHSSTPFSLMFGRRLNGFDDYNGVQSKPLNEDELLSRIETLTKLVYPAIFEKSKQSQNKIPLQRNRAQAKTDPFPVRSYVMVKDVLRRGKLDPR